MTATAMPTAETGEVFRQAMETFERAIKAGVKIQEESTKCFVDMFSQMPSPQQWQKRAQAMLNDAFPTAQKNLDEAIEVMNQNARSSLSLLKKAFEAGQSTSIAEAQAKTSELWEAALETVRSNAQAMVQANERFLKAWEELAHKEMANA